MYFEKPRPKARGQDFDDSGKACGKRVIGTVLLLWVWVPPHIEALCIRLLYIGVIYIGTLYAPLYMGTSIYRNGRIWGVLYI